MVEGSGCTTCTGVHCFSKEWVEDLRLLDSVLLLPHSHKANTGRLCSIIAFLYGSKMSRNRKENGNEREQQVHGQVRLCARIYMSALSKRKGKVRGLGVLAHQCVTRLRPGSFSVAEDGMNVWKTQQTQTQKKKTQLID